MAPATSPVASPPRLDWTSLAASFERLGFAVIPGVLRPTEVAGARAMSDRFYASIPAAARGVSGIGAPDEMLASEFLRLPVLSGVPFRPRVARLLRQLLGKDYLTYPNITLRKSVYVPWHVDGAFVLTDADARGSTLRHVQCAIYLQDNSAANGGGIDVIAGSHRSAHAARQVDEAERLARGNQLVPRARLLRSSAGDLVLWHGRLVHRSTPSRRPGGPTKYGIHFATSTNSPYLSNRYLCHLLSRRYELDESALHEVARYAELAYVSYPRSFSPTARALIEAQRLQVATFARLYPARRR